MDFVARIGVKRNVYRILIQKPEKKSVLGTPSVRWEDNTEKYFEEIGRENVDWTYLAPSMDEWWFTK
jgi:hypothetical protein